MLELQEQTMELSNYRPDLQVQKTKKKKKNDLQQQKGEKGELKAADFGHAQTECVGVERVLGRANPP